ncbi:MAG: hypothetical protein ACTSPK_00065 [Candidatus Heimdallarchaeota archaeon]
MSKANLAIARRVVQDSDEKPHLSGGISSHGGCVGKQILDHHFPMPFDGQGGTMGGNIIHKYIQELYPSGTLIMNEFGEDEWLVIGHEQYIIVHRENGWDRRSPVDTLIYNIKTNEYEVWDYKSTRVDIQYVKKKPLSQKYQLQANMYGIQLKWQWSLPYFPICRVIFINKADVSDTFEYTFRCNEELKANSIRKMDIVDYGKDDFENVAESWFDIIDGMSISSHTKNAYRYECRYCSHAPITERVVYKRSSAYGEVGDIKEGSKQCTGKCLDILNLACKKKFKKDFEDFDGFLDFFNDHISGLGN